MAVGTVVLEVVETQVDLRVLVDQVFHRGGADLVELLSSDLSNRTGGGEGLALDARAGDGDGVKARRSLLCLLFAGVLGDCRAGAREYEGAGRKRERNCIAKLVPLQSHLSLQVSWELSQREPGRWSQRKRQIRQGCTRY